MKLLKIFIFFFTFAVIIASPIILYILLTKTKYKCDTTTGLCTKDSSGKYNSLNDCNNKCTKPTKYKCDTGTGSCIKDDTGSFTSQDECNSKCKVYITLDDFKLIGKGYSNFTGTDAFQTAKDVCSKDINCQGINRFPNSASVVKEATQIVSTLGVYTSIFPSSKGKYIISYYPTSSTILAGTEYKGTTQFNGKDINEIMKYCLYDKDAEGYNCKFVENIWTVTLVKNVTGTKYWHGLSWYGVKYGDH